MADTHQLTSKPEDMITKDMTIGDVVKRYPMVTETLLANGVHCVGCGARFFETVEMGLKGHGMSDEQVDMVITQLNQAVKNNAVEGDIIVITERAASKLKDILRQEKKEDYALRIQIVPSDAGQSYGLDFDKVIHEEDTVVEAFGVKLVVNAESLPIVRGARIDYVEGENAGFRISNPKTAHGCGCH